MTDPSFKQKLQALVEASTLHDLLVCDPDAGLLYWKERTPSMFEPSRRAEIQCRAFNNTFSGKPALHSLTDQGYRAGVLLGKRALAHRVIWAMTQGSWPRNEVDHINGDRSDNRICNLRDVSREDNSKNQQRHSSNTSGQTGVVWKPKISRWNARIRVRGKFIHLGYFDDFSTAAKVRKAAEHRYGFHHNHGRASNG